MQESAKRARSLVALLIVAGAADAHAIDYLWLFEVQTEAIAATEKATAADPEPGSWAELKREFDRICGRVQAASAMSAKELETLIADCHALTERLQQSDEPQAKIFLKRIEMCRDFFAYSLEVLQAEEG